MAGAAFIGVSAQTPESEIIGGAYATSISDNGRWLLGQADGEGYLYIKDLANDTYYIAGGNLSRDGVGYVSGLGKSIANDGTAIALVNGIPFYWTPTGGNKGTWTELPGDAVDGSAVVGSITPDGSMIVGGCGSTGTTIDDVQMTNPCIWQRRADGSFGEPFYLPNPGRDPFGDVPQHVKCIAVSEDGSVIAATMTSGSGFYETPLLYIRNDADEWEIRNYGSAFLNPEGREVVRMPHDLDSYLPSPWTYLNEQQADAYMDAFQDWIRQEPQASMDPGSDDYLKLQYLFMAEFMTPSDKEKYLNEFYEFMEQYDELVARTQAYYDFINYVNTEGTNIVENNACISPDGKYAFFTGTRTIVDDPTQGEAGIYSISFPVRLEVATGTVKVYESKENYVLSSVSADYSILCRNVGLDAYWPGAAYIFPHGAEDGMPLPDFIMQNGSEEAYDWMEENMYREVITGVNASGAFIYGDSWTVGIPYCTPDMSLIACANSPMYWADTYYNTTFSYVSFILATGITTEEPGDSGIAETEAPLTLSTEYFDLSGKKAAVSNLAPGIYIVRETLSNGTTVAKKVVVTK